MTGVSRLDSFIRRLEAQRACLNATPAWIEGLAGPILELGLGNGRTYDHLRGFCTPTARSSSSSDSPRRIPIASPTPAHLVLGDIRSTLPAALGRLPDRAALVHNDLGTGDSRPTHELASGSPPRCRP